MGEKFLENEGLVYDVIRRKFGRVRGEEMKDIEQAGRIGLMKAEKKFLCGGKEVGKFSTYAEKCIENEIRAYYRRERIKERRATESLGAVIGRLESDEVTWADVLEAEGERVEEILERKEIRLMIYKAAEGMRGRKSEIIRMWLAGENGARIGEKFGISRQAVNMVVQEYRRELKEKLKKAELWEAEKKK